MNNNKFNEKKLKKIDQIKLIPDEELENMDFYELAYYMQTLNMIDSLSIENQEGEENVWITCFK